MSGLRFGRVRPYRLVDVVVQRRQVCSEWRMRRALLFHCCSATWPFTKAWSRGRGHEHDDMPLRNGDTGAHAPDSITASPSVAAWVCIFGENKGKCSTFEMYLEVHYCFGVECKVGRERLMSSKCFRRSGSRKNSHQSHENANNIRGNNDSCYWRHKTYNQYTVRVFCVDK